MTLSIPGVSQDVGLISTQKIILDRSNCSDLTFYPGTSSTCAEKGGRGEGEGREGARWKIEVGR